MKTIRFIADSEGRLNVSLSARSDSVKPTRLPKGFAVLATVAGLSGDLADFQRRLQRQQIGQTAWYKLDSDAEAVLRAVRAIQHLDAARRVIWQQLVQPTPADVLQEAARRLDQAAHELAGNAGVKDQPLEATTIG